MIPTYNPLLLQGAFLRMMLVVENACSSLWRYFVVYVNTNLFSYCILSVRVSSVMSAIVESFTWFCMFIKISWVILLMLQEMDQSTSKENDEGVNKLKSSTSNSNIENTSKEIFKSPMTARASDSTRVAKFTKELSVPTVRLGICGFVSYWWFS